MNSAGSASGYTILDNVVIYDGTVYLVTEDQTSLPPINSIVETTGSGHDHWQVITKAEGLNKIGKYGGM